MDLVWGTLDVTFKNEMLEYGIESMCFYLRPKSLFSRPQVYVFIEIEKKNVSVSRNR